QVKMQQQLSNRDASLLKSCSTKNGTTATSKITTCKNGATTLGPTVISASIAAAIGSYLRWKQTVVFVRVSLTSLP
ncbi:hypothetical protein Tco_0477095, partial [Tanacetum coccineum]